MYFLINELSFVCQFKDSYEVQSFMEEIRLILKEVKLIKGLKLYTHHTLYERELFPGCNVFNWLKESFNKPDKDQDFLLLMIGLIAKEKCVSKALDKEFEDDLYYWECEFNKISCSDSSLAGAAYFGGKLISIKKSKEFDAISVSVNFTRNTELPVEVNLENLLEISHAQGLRPKFLYHPKHDFRGSWKDATPMDLSEEDAQRALDESVIYEGHTQRYSLFGSRYYVFQDDNAGGYHGYPIPKENVPNSVLKLLDF